MISYGHMLDVVEKEETKNAPQTPPPSLVETPKEKNDDMIEDVIDEEEEVDNEN